MNLWHSGFTAFIHYIWGKNCCCHVFLACSMVCQDNVCNIFLLFVSSSLLFSPCGLNETIERIFHEKNQIEKKKFMESMSLSCVIYQKTFRLLWSDIHYTYTYIYNTYMYIHWIVSSINELVEWASQNLKQNYLLYILINFFFDIFGWTSL